MQLRAAFQRASPDGRWPDLVRTACDGVADDDGVAATNDPLDDLVWRASRLPQPSATPGRAVVTRGGRSGGRALAMRSARTPHPQRPGAGGLDVRR